MKRVTARQHVAALVSTTERYMSGMMVRQTWRTHMRCLWARIEQSPAMRRRVLKQLEAHDAQRARQSFLLVRGGAR